MAGGVPGKNWTCAYCGLVAATTAGKPAECPTCGHNGWLDPTTDEVLAGLNAVVTRLEARVAALEEAARMAGWFDFGWLEGK